MALSKDWEKRLETIGNTPIDDTSKRIMAGIEASKKRNAELAKDVDKRRAEYEAKQKAAKKQPKAANKSSKKAPVSSATTVRHHKGGGATAEVDTEKVTRQAKADAAKKELSTKAQTPKRTSQTRRVLSSSDSEAQKEKAAEGARQTAEHARSAVGTSPRKYYDAEAKARRKKIAGRSILEIIRDHTGRRSRKEK